MDSALSLHRLQFAFTITFHYIFPQITMGLALLIVILKTMALRTGDPRYDSHALFWGRIFGLNFAFGVVTGIPMEFQFGTNWARFSKLTGAVIGQTLALEGMYSFFLESAFLGLFLFGREKLGRIGHWFSALAVTGWESNEGGGDEGGDDAERDEGAAGVLVFAGEEVIRAGSRH